MKNRFILALLFALGSTISVVIFYQLSVPQKQRVTDDVPSKQLIDDIHIKQKTNDNSEQVPSKPFVKPKSVRLDAPLIRQNPELYNGCEVTSLTMLLQYNKLKVNKLQLAKAVPKDPTPLKVNKHGTAISWGNPNKGFVGDITGKRRGYSIYHQALYPFLKTYLKSAVDLTGGSYERLELKLAEKKPVIVWTTTHYGVPYRWVQWNTALGPMRATYEQHAVLLVGYDDSFVYVNDPLSGRKNHKIAKAKFKKGWIALGRQAISY